MNELIKYFEALEARISAQEARIAALEQHMSEKKRIIDQLAQEAKGMAEVLDAIGEHIKKMDATLEETLQKSAEPEVEVELVYPEEEEAVISMPTAEEQKLEPVAPVAPVAPAAPEPEPMVEVVPAPEPEELPAPEPVVEPVVQPEPVVAAPVVEPVVETPAPQPEPVREEPAPAEAPKPRMPQQTSLFGAAVSDIRQAVSIGDRFLFQRELFGGNAERLQQALSELDALHSFDEAVASIDKFGWDKQSPTYELFINVLHRRFG